MPMKYAKSQKNMFEKYVQVEIVVHISTLQKRWINGGLRVLKSPS